MSDYLPQINEYLDLIFAYGAVWVYLAIFAACLIENLAPPFPGDSFIVAAGALVAVSRLDPYVSMIVVCAGGMTSVMVWYGLGRFYGRDYFARHNFRFITAKDVTLAEEKFARWGGLILVVSRFVMGMRVVLALAAGIAAYSAIRMFVYTLVSYVLFAGLLMYLGYKLVENLDRVEYYFTTYNYIVWPIVVALVAVYLFRHIRRNGKGNKA